MVFQSVKTLKHFLYSNLLFYLLTRSNVFMSMSLLYHFLRIQLPSSLTPVLSNTLEQSFVYRSIPFYPVLSRSIPSMTTP